MYYLHLTSVSAYQWNHCENGYRVEHSDIEKNAYETTYSKRATGYGNIADKHNTEKTKDKKELIYLY